MENNMNKFLSPLSLGVDPSLSETGVIGIRDGKVEVSQLIKTKRTGETPIDELERLRSIVKEVKKLIDKHQPAAVAIEGIAMMARNTTALAQLCGLNYMIRDMLYGLTPMYVVTPTGLKKFITGKGNCKKDLMMLETYKRYGVSFSNNNLCDAYSLARVCEAIIVKDLKLTAFQEEVTKVIKKQYEK
jgi:crossover junction endodeoxyribonuclease RuvC